MYTHIMITHPWREVTFYSVYLYIMLVNTFVTHIVFVISLGLILIL